jgi:hypothetical protein
MRYTVVVKRSACPDIDVVVDVSEKSGVDTYVHVIYYYFILLCYHEIGSFHVYCTFSDILYLNFALHASIYIFVRSILSTSAC